MKLDELLLTEEEIAEKWNSQKGSGEWHFLLSEALREKVRIVAKAQIDKIKKNLISDEDIRMEIINFTYFHGDINKFKEKLLLK